MIVSKHLIWAALLSVLCVAGAASATPAHRAVLIAVEDYDKLPGVSLYTGPRNSVLLWHDYLRAQGFSDVTVLAEGINASDVKWTSSDPQIALPTRSNIERAFVNLERKLEKSAGEDDVLIVLAGHGSQQRAAPNDPPKPFNLDEVFLPSDAGPRPDGDPQGPFANALVDHDIAPHLKNISKHSGFIWLIFDSCHSDTMTYDSLLLRSRPLTTSGMASLEYESRTPTNPLAPAAPAPAFGPSPRDKDWPKNYVAFFASSADQTTPLVIQDAGLITPRIGPGPARFTAFSYFIVDTLKKNPNTNFEAILASVRASYRATYPSDSYEPKSEGGARMQLPVASVLGTPSR